MSRTMVKKASNPNQIRTGAERKRSLGRSLDVMAVGNPTMQRMLSERRAALGLPSRNPEESDPNRQQQSNPTDYFDNM
ncbi:hypothetical protein F2Q68_00033083 [Brassica cretica]|uniref:Uncharacterized protein n=1 Tax=Brassica cretica TaxID=69181 RepID=A0A8S9G7I7_BRACR|nr:hypothetical protein F2Q68_00033083 [Brassica cretica]